MGQKKRYKISKQQRWKRRNAAKKLAKKNPPQAEKQQASPQSTPAEA